MAVYIIYRFSMNWLRYPHRTTYIPFDKNNLLFLLSGVVGGDKRLAQIYPFIVNVFFLKEKWILWLKGYIWYNWNTTQISPCHICFVVAAYICAVKIYVTKKYNQKQYIQVLSRDWDFIISEKLRIIKIK